MSIIVAAITLAIIFCFALVIIMALKMHPPKFQTWGESVIWRSTGIFGDFNMDITLCIMEREWPKVSASATTEILRQDVHDILKRYHDHVSYWNVDINVIQRELERFANITTKPNVAGGISDIFAAFNVMSERSVHL